MAGALAKHFEGVEIFEPDRLTASAASRSGTPQIDTRMICSLVASRHSMRFCRISSVSALDLAVALHEIVPEVPIVMATASADASGADALVAAGAFEVVHRPLISAEIAAALARCLTGPAFAPVSYAGNAFSQN